MDEFDDLDTADATDSSSSTSSLIGCGFDNSLYGLTFGVLGVNSTCGQSAPVGVPSIISDPVGTIKSAASSILPSGTEVWVSVAAIIVVLVLVAYIAREVAG
jgi:hypothetical protein